MNEELCKPIINAKGSGQPLLELSNFVKISLIELVLVDEKINKKSMAKTV